jgi:hypothetical protein
MATTKEKHFVRVLEGPRGSYAIPAAKKQEFKTRGGEGFEEFLITEDEARTEALVKALLDDILGGEALN